MKTTINEEVQMRRDEIWTREAAGGQGPPHLQALRSLAPDARKPHGGLYSLRPPPTPGLPAFLSLWSVMPCPSSLPSAPREAPSSEDAPFPSPPRLGAQHHLWATSHDTAGAHLRLHSPPAEGQVHDPPLFVPALIVTFGYQALAKQPARETDAWWEKRAEEMRTDRLTGSAHLSLLVMRACWARQWWQSRTWRRYQTPCG